MAEEPRVSEFERELFARLSLEEQFMVLTALESGVADSVRDALAQVREFQEPRGE